MPDPASSTPGDSDAPRVPSLPSELEERVYEIWFDQHEPERAAALAAVRTDHPEHSVALRLLHERLTSSDDLLGKVQSEVEQAKPTRIGNYEVLDEVGAGGFGVVFRAKQSEPVSRIVAIKLLHAGRMHGASLIRFQNEQQALALMDHPAIAHVFDAGTTSEGQPYFVMEYVEGVPITEFCDEHQLDIPARLDLFRSVCAAVHHAHQKGIVHRDLKPSNVLVFDQDGQPAPKIIDFGVAKAMLGSAARHSFATLEGGLVGTPEYMSPEQAASKPIDTRTDVYALGVLLFELLTGDLPFARQRLKTGSLVEVARIVCEEEPQRPSRSLTRSSTDVVVVAKNRDTNPQKLARNLRADLDWVVLKALQKEPADRYGSVVTLAEDVESYQRNLPVQARQPLFFYVARKFVARHRVGVAVAAFVALTCTTGVAGLIWGLVEIGRARDDAVTKGLEATQKGTEAKRKGLEAAAQRDRAVLNEYAAKIIAARMAMDAGAVAAAERHLATTPVHLRGWEWRYLNALCDQSAVQIELRMGALNGLEWISDTQLVVAPTEAKSIVVWDLVTQSVVRTLEGFAEWNTQFRLTSDRKTVVTASPRGVESWSVDTGQRLAYLGPLVGELLDTSLSADGSKVVWCERGGLVRVAPVSGARPHRDLWRSKGRLQRVRFTPDGESLFVSAWKNKEAWISVVDLDSGAVRRTLDIDTLPLDIMVLDAAGTTLYTAGISCVIRAWDFANGDLLHEYPCPDRVATLFFSSNGERIYAAGGWFVGWVESLDTATFEQIGLFNGHALGVRGCVLSPDGQRFATASRDGTLRIWPMESRPRFREIYSDAPARQLAKSRDGKRLAIASTRGSWRVWDTDTLETVGSGKVDQYLRGCAVDGEHLYAFGKSVFPFDIGSGTASPPLPSPCDDLRDLIVLPDATLIGRTYRGQVVRFDPRKNDAETRGPGELVELDFVVQSLRWERARDRLVAGCADGVVRFLRPKTLEVLEEFSATPGKGVKFTAIHGDRLAVSDDDGTVLIFDVARGGPHVTCRGPVGRWLALSFSPDGSRLVTGCADKTVRIWDPSTGTELLSLVTPYAANEVFFSNDGRKLFVRSQRWFESNTSIQVFEAPAK